MRRYYKAGGKVKGRDYEAEYDDYHSLPEQKKRRAKRNAARRKLEREGRVSRGDGRDVNHKNRATLSNADSDLSVTSQKANRGWRKGKRGY